MAKQSSKKDPEKKVLHKLSKARLALEVAQEKYAQSRVRGKQEIEKARLRAARWQIKASERVQRRAEGVARLEARLIELTSSPVPDEETRAGAEQPEPAVLSPETAAEIIEQRTSDAHPDGSGGSLLIAESAEIGHEQPDFGKLGSI